MHVAGHLIQRAKISKHLLDETRFHTLDLSQFVVQLARNFGTRIIVCIDTQQRANQCAWLGYADVDDEIDSTFAYRNTAVSFIPVPGEGTGQRLASIDKGAATFGNRSISLVERETLFTGRDLKSAGRTWPAFTRPGWNLIKRSRRIIAYRSDQLWNRSPSMAWRSPGLLLTRSYFELRQADQLEPAVLLLDVPVSFCEAHNVSWIFYTRTVLYELGVKVQIVKGVTVWRSGYLSLKLVIGFVDSVCRFTRDSSSIMSTVVLLLDSMEAILCETMKSALG